MHCNDFGLMVSAVLKTLDGRGKRKVEKKRAEEREGKKRTGDEEEIG